MPGHHFLIICLAPGPTTPPQGMSVGVQCVPFGGVCFHQSCIQNTCITFKLHSMYYVYMYYFITCTVKSPMSLTCVSFKLFNILHVHVVCVQLSL